MGQTEGGKGSRDPKSLQGLLIRPVQRRVRRRESRPVQNFSGNFAWMIDGRTPADNIPIPRRRADPERVGESRGSSLTTRQDPVLSRGLGSRRVRGPGRNADVSGFGGAADREQLARASRCRSRVCGASGPRRASWHLAGPGGRLLARRIAPSGARPLFSGAANLSAISPAGFGRREITNHLKGLILAQNERWWRGLGMQVVREGPFGGRRAANGVVRRRDVPRGPG